MASRAFIVDGRGILLAWSRDLGNRFAMEWIFGRGVEFEVGLCGFLGIRDCGSTMGRDFVEFLVYEWLVRSCGFG